MGRMGWTKPMPNRRPGADRPEHAQDGWLDPDQNTARPAAIRATPILMLTTESSDDMKVQGKAAGATGWMVKPFDPHKLLEVVKKVLARHRQSI